MKRLKRGFSLCLIPIMTLALVMAPLPTGSPNAFAAEQEIAGVTPVGTTIDLFDYWVESKDGDGAINFGANSGLKTMGINRHSDLKFTYVGTGENNINKWTGTGGGIYEGIVQKKPDNNGYPVLQAGNPNGFGEEKTSAAPLDYLFNYESIADAKDVYADVHGLFQVDENGYYSFDSNQTAAQLNADNSFTLVDYDSAAKSSAKGFFPFDRIHTNADGAADGYCKKDTDELETDCKNFTLNHFFGSHMMTQFIQSADGLTDAGTPTTYEFTGDDDVWIFIDGVLVGDVGGIHNAASVKIDFSTGQVSYELTNSGNGEVYPDDDRASTLWAQYTEIAGADNVKYYTVSDGGDGGDGADKTETADEATADLAEITIDGDTHAFCKNADGSWIFADDSYHTLDFFYLERGAGDSNMQLKFNLATIPPTHIKKVDQDGSGIGGVGFDLYVVEPEKETDRWVTGDDTREITRIATGVTDANGSLTLRYSEEMGSKKGKVASLADLFNTYKEYKVDTVVSSANLEYKNAILLELRETAAAHNTLENYRHSEAVSLRLENINGTYILRSNDRWNSGVYATPSVVVSAPKIIHLRNPIENAIAPAATDEIDLSKDQEGKVGLFGVVLAWVGENPPTEGTIQNEANWAPVHGSAESGWKIENLNIQPGDDYAVKLGRAISDYANEHQGSAEGFVYPFALSASGSYNTTIENLPGEINQYYFMTADANGNIVDTNNNGSTADEFAQIKYTTSFYYSSAPSYAEMTGERTSRVDHRNSNFQRDFGSTIGVPNIENRLLVQRLDAQGNTVCGADFALYAAEQVEVAADGTAALKEGATPLAELTTDNLDKDPEIRVRAHVTADGVGAFHGIPEGEYYVAETKAPVGYAPNKNLVRVIVDDDGVHAYAGKPLTDESGEEQIDENKGVAYGDGDGISVLTGVGNLVSTMADFGSAGEIDTTLTDIYVLRAKGEVKDAGAYTHSGSKLNWMQVDPAQYQTLQRKWRVYSNESAMQYKYATEPDALGNTNELENTENPYGYLSSSGWNTNLITQNYYGIYDQGRRYDDLDLTEAEEKAIAKEISTKTPLPNIEYSADATAEEKFGIENGYTSFGNKILNGLFSGSTTIRVAATAVGNLKISKAVETAPDAEAPDATAFPFSVAFKYERPEMNYTDDRPANMVGDIDLAPELEGSYEYTIRQAGAYDNTDDETGTLTIERDAEGEGYHIAGLTTAAGTADTAHFDADTNKLLLAGGETLTIINLPIGVSYTVAEDNIDGYQQSLTAAATSEAENSDGQKYTPNRPTATGTTASNKIEVPGQTDTLTYTNIGAAGAYPYTVNYYEWDAENNQPTATAVHAAKTGDAQPFGKVVAAEAEKIDIAGYAFSQADKDALTISNKTADNVLNLYYVKDDAQTKELSYTVEYYKDGVKADGDTQTVKQTVHVSAPDTLTVDKTQINTTDKYAGYKFSKTEPAVLPDTVESGSVIKVYYVKDTAQTKELSYTVEYYKDGVKADGDTQTVKQSVHVSAPDTLTVDKTQINTADKYAGYKFSKTEPAVLPDTVESGSVIKVYYVKQSSGHNHSKPQDLNSDEHIAYIIGYPDGGVHPDGSITRAEVATIFFRLLTNEAREANWQQTNDYTDVPAAMWCNNAVSTLSNMGVISGDPNGAFRPNDPITRAELAKISVGFFNSTEGRAGGQNYTDVQGGEWYAEYVAAAAGLNLVEGYPDNTFRPNAYVTRAEACTMVNRILLRYPNIDHLLADDAMLNWGDNPKDAWYYTQIQEATNSHDYRLTGADGEELEEWTARQPERDWAALEKEWSTAADGSGNDVVKK